MLTSMTTAREKTKRRIQNGIPPSNFTSCQSSYQGEMCRKSSDLSKEFAVSRRQVYRIWAEPPIKHSARATTKTKRNVGGRPSKLNPGQKL